MLIINWETASYNNENLRKEMGIKSRKIVEDKFTWKKMSERYLEVFEGLV